MDRSNIIYLISNAQTQDSYGIWSDSYTKKQVYCQVDSVTRTEWYEGGRNGLNPQYRFTMFAPDYSGETEIEYNSNVYTVYRTYLDKNENIELYAELKKGNEDITATAS